MRSALRTFFPHPCRQPASCFSPCQSNNRGWRRRGLGKKRRWRPGLHSAASRIPQAQPSSLGRREKAGGRVGGLLSALRPWALTVLTSARGGAAKLTCSAPPRPPRHQEAGEVAPPASVRVVRSAPPSRLHLPLSLPPQSQMLVARSASGVPCGTGLVAQSGRRRWRGRWVGGVWLGAEAGSRAGRHAGGGGPCAFMHMSKVGSPPQRRHAWFGLALPQVIRSWWPGQLAVGLFLARFSLCRSRPAGRCGDARWWRALLQGHCRREQRWWPAAPGSGAGQALPHPLGALAAGARGVACLDGPLCGAAAPGWSGPCAGTGSNPCGGRSRVFPRD